MISDPIKTAKESQDRRDQRPRLGSWFNSEGESIPKRKSWSESLQRVHAYGLVVIFAGFLGLAAWSSFLDRRFSLTVDYSFYSQAWFLIAHGHLNPYSTTFPTSFWHNAFELVMWPLAVLWFIWPHSVTLLWTQDAATAGCEAIVFVWMCEVTARLTRDRNLGIWSIAFPLTGLFLLVANPWTVWIDSFDFHPEAIALFFFLLAAHAFWKGRNRLGWIAAMATLTCGAIGATYVAGLGISAILAGRRWRRLGFTLLAIGVLWILMITHIGGDQAAGVYSNLTKGSHLKSTSAFDLARIIVEHPGRALSAIWSVRRDVYADIAGGGFVGLLNPWVFGVSVLVLLEGSLTGSAGLIQPYVQNSLPLAILIPLGTVGVCVALAVAGQKWKRICAFALAALSILNMTGWTLTWFHRTEPQWVSVPSSTAQVLDQTLSKIRPGDEVIASQGIMGPFSLRQWVYPLLRGPVSQFPVHSRTVWFVISPMNGIETETTTGAESQIGQISNLPHASLVADSNGVFVFRWRPGSRQTTVNFSDIIPAPAWTLYSFPTTTIVTGPAKLWHVESVEHYGFVVDGDIWRLHNGSFNADVRLASNGVVHAALVNATTGTVLTEVTLPSTHGLIKTRSFVGTFRNTVIPKAYSGSGLFSVDPVQPPPQDLLEIQVLVPSTTHASVYSIGLSNSQPKT